jgi:glutamate N-acetyltransferase/amino-acid N-acetyltransferase
MTTDTVPKAVSRQVVIDGRTVTVTGIAKGAGMIEPNMATMLGFIATDACVAATTLHDLHAARRQPLFNAISIDGDTSTNDTLLVAATGARATRDPRRGHGRVRAAHGHACARSPSSSPRRSCATARAPPSSSPSRSTAAHARRVLRVGKRIANSPLVKTAFFASDPNLGRILAAVGNAGIADLDPRRSDLQLGDVTVARTAGARPLHRGAGQGGDEARRDHDARSASGRGDETATVWTCDFSYDYVKINADYRS